jgi:hypothetical protein
MTPDLRPEALLALAHAVIAGGATGLEEEIAATLRALAAQEPPSFEQYKASAALAESLRQRCAELEQLLKVMERQYAAALEGFAKMIREPAGRYWEDDNGTCGINCMVPIKNGTWLYRKGE